MDESAKALLDPQVLTILGGLVIAIGVAMKVIGSLIDIRYLRPQMDRLSVDLDPVVLAVQELGKSIGERLETSERAMIEVLSDIRNGQKATVKILEKEDARGLPRVYCSSPETLEKATAGPFKDLRDEMRLLTQEVKRRRGE
jgi:hypothetical protein